MEKKAKVICKNNFKSSCKEAVEIELAEKVVKLISWMDNLSTAQIGNPSSTRKI